MERYEAYGWEGLRELSRAPHQHARAVDFKGWCRTGDGKHCEPLTMSDYATRYLLCCQGLESTRTELVRPVMERVFRQYGIPERIRSDNGAPFASQGECGLTELAVWWIELGMEWERIEPGHPQWTARAFASDVERSNHAAASRDLAATTTAGRSLSQGIQRTASTRSSGPAASVALYRCASRQYSAVIAEPQYGREWLVRKVDGGQVRYLCQRFFLSHALKGKWVGLEPTEEGLWKIWFYRHWLGVWDEKTGRLYRPYQWQREQVRRAARSLPEGHEATAE